MAISITVNGEKRSDISLFSKEFPKALEAECIDKAISITKRGSADYVPFDTGELRDSARQEGTDLVYDTPYARRLYYHPEYNFQGAPMRGAYWPERYLQNGGMDEINRAIDIEVQKGADKLIK